MPTSPSRSLARARPFVRFIVAYGLMSRLREPAGASTPTSVAAIDDCCTLCIPRPAGTRVISDNSFFQRTVRSALKPQTCAAPSRYRSDLNGIAISTVHPPSKRPTAKSQIGFQSAEYCRSFVIWPSFRPPIELMVNADPVAPVVKRVQEDRDEIVAAPGGAAVAAHLGRDPAIRLGCPSSGTRHRRDRGRTPARFPSSRSPARPRRARPGRNPIWTAPSGRAPHRARRPAGAAHRDAPRESSPGRPRRARRYPAPLEQADRQRRTAPRDRRPCLAGAEPDWPAAPVPVSTTAARASGTVMVRLEYVRGTDCLRGLAQFLSELRNDDTSSSLTERMSRRFRTTPRTETTTNIPAPAPRSTIERAPTVNATCFMFSSLGSLCGC